MPTPGGWGYLFLADRLAGREGEGYDFCRFSSRISLIAFRLRRGNLCKFALFLEISFAPYLVAQLAVFHCALLAHNSPQIGRWLEVIAMA